MNPRHSIPLPAVPPHAQATGDEVLEQIIKRIRRTKEFPAISTYLVEINEKLSDSAPEASASDLANVILKDYALTSKILKLVNSAFFGVVSGKVTTVSRAVVILGENNVRMMAVGLVLFDHFRNGTEARDLKAAINSSFWRGLLAREIAGLLKGVDPEEAFICALLFQLGKLLTIYHMPENYAEIKQRIANDKLDESMAVRQVLGVSYRALGATMVKQWALPEVICNAMATIPPGRLGKKGSGLGLLNVLANFADALSQLIDTIPWAKRGAAIKKLLHIYRHYLTISEEQFHAVLAESLSGVYKHAEAMQLDTQNCPFLQRLAGPKATNRDESRSDPPSDPVQGNPFRLFNQKSLQAPLAKVATDDSISIIMDGIQEIASVMMEDHHLNDVALMSIEIMYRALQSSRVIMFVNEGRHGNMEARYGYGSDVDQFVGDVKFKVNSAEDLFSQSIASGNDLLVEDTHAPALQQLIPHWYKATINARALLFLPVVFNKICVGAFYADYDQPGPPINALEHKYLSLLRNQLVLAIKLSK